MRKFISYLFILLATSFLLLCILDFLYTIIYENSVPRNKISLAHHGKIKNYDVVFLGSSRANNHFDPKLFIAKGYKSFNYGMSGSRLEETALQLQLLVDRGTKIKNIILEVDLNLNSNGCSEGTRALFYPYIKNSKSISHYYEHLDDFKSIYNFPFYRYMRYDAKIGFRELYFSALRKETSSMQSYGFYALKNKGKNLEYDLSDYSPKPNKGYEEIKQICSACKINLIAVTTPMCENIKNKDYFNEVVKLYPEIHNLENVVTDENSFSSCGHMNKQGATQFTNYILDNFFK